MEFPSTQEKYRRVIEKNTFYFYDREFEEKYEGYLNSLKETLLILKNRIKNEGLKKEIFVDVIQNKENGLRALLALTGFSNEYFKRLITFVRVVDDPELNKLIYKNRWYKPVEGEISEWGDSRIAKLIKKNKYFAMGIVNMFWEGASVPIISRALPLFELKKLSIEKLSFKIEAMIDTIVRYKEKGSYSGKTERNPTTYLEKIFKEMNIPFDKEVDLPKLAKKEDTRKRKMDFLIPSKEKPLLIIECSYLVTTSSGQGDKSKTEVSINDLIKRYYPNAIFIGFVDGIGWYVRKKDLKRMVSSYDNVFTFHEKEIERFKKLLMKIKEDKRWIRLLTR